MINWRCIKDVGFPTDFDAKYLVTNGQDISTSGIATALYLNALTPVFFGWDGDDNTTEHNECCSGQRMFDMVPTHWCPTSELNLPANSIEPKED